MNPNASGGAKRSGPPPVPRIPPPAQASWGFEGAEPLVSPTGDMRSVATGDSPPFVNAVKGGAVTPRRGAGRAGQCAAWRAGGCRPSIALGSARRCSEPRSAPTLARSSKGSTASPRRPLPGFEGAESLASLAVIPWVCWLDHTNSGPSQPGERPQTLRRAARNGGSPTVAGKLPGLLVDGLTDGESESDPGTLGDGGALSREAEFRPTATPSGTRDRRSEAILWPVYYPKCFRAAPKRPLSRSRGQIRSWCLLTGPRDRPPSPP